MSLRDLQTRLTAALQHPDHLGESPFAADAERIAVGNSRLSPVDQIDIYREQYFLRHVDAVAEDYPALCTLMGWDAFEAVVLAYLAAHPPTSFSLRDLGALFPAFLAQREAAPDAPALARLHTDLARLEWALVDAFDAASVSPLDPAKLQQAGEAFDTAVISVDPSVTLLALRYPVHTVRPALMDGDEVSPPAARATCLVVNRNELALDWNEIPKLAFQTLDALRRGEKLGEALDAIAAALPEDEVAGLVGSVGGWFSDWVRYGYIRDVAFD